MKNNNVFYKITNICKYCKLNLLKWAIFSLYLQVFQVGPHELEADGDPGRQPGRLQVFLKLLVLARIHERVGAEQRREVRLKL